MALDSAKHYYYSLEQFQKDIPVLADQIKTSNHNFDYIFPIPRGGVPIGLELSRILNIPLIKHIHHSAMKEKVLVVDDVVHSGKTRKKYWYTPFAALHVKADTPSDKFPSFYVSKETEWIKYWWEGGEQPAEDAVIRMIQAIGENINRDGLKETPKRIVKSWEELFCGYKANPEDVFKQFNSDGYNQIVLLKDIEFFSCCEHHMLPFFGKAHIAYIPKEKVIGISKLARLMEIYSRRMQIQERIGEQITSDIMKHLDAQGAACVIEAQHLCMKMRGVNKQHSVMITSSVKGAFMDNAVARQELMELIR